MRLFYTQILDKITVYAILTRKLRKFFRLEAENKYANTAVIGGLAKILDFWEAEARNEWRSRRTHSTGLLAPARLPPADPRLARQKRSKGCGSAFRDRPMPPCANRSISRKLPRSRLRPRLAPSPAPEERPSSRARPQPEAAPARRPAPARSAAYAGAQTSQTPIALNASLTVLQGVGPRNAEALKKLGLYTLGDMLYNFPRRYDDYSRLKPIRSLVYGEVVTVIGQVQNLYERKARGGKMSLVECVLTDERRRAARDLVQPALADEPPEGRHGDCGGGQGGAISGPGW